MKVKFITLILILTSVMGVAMMTGCGSNGVSAAPADQSEETQVLQQEETQAADVIDEGQMVAESNAADIGPEKVKKIVIAKVPGAVESNIYEFEREIDDGRIEYEGSLYHDGYEYEFEVDGATGNILKWEIDN